MRRRLLPLLLLALVAGLFAAGQSIRTELGLELSVESIRGLVAPLGWKGPALFAGLVTFRQFLLLPSTLLLAAGGLAFGAVVGTAFGAAGVALSALVKFGIARLAGRDWLERRYGERLRSFDRRLGRAGPVVVAAATAHPTGPMSPFHWGAGFSSMGALAFLAAVALASPIRAGSLSLFGASALEPGTPRFWLATGLLAGVALLPLLHRGLRRRLFGGWGDAAREARGPAASGAEAGPRRASEP